MKLHILLYHNLTVLKIEKILPISIIFIYTHNLKCHVIKCLVLMLKMAKYEIC